MLGKLVKYDIKSLNRFLIIIHGVLLLSAVLIRFFFTENITAESLLSSETNNSMPFTLVMTIILYSLLVTCISFATGLIITVRFYKNLFSDEGYLTQTLPVTCGQHLLSKTISGGLWSCIDACLVFVSLYIVIATPDITGLFRQHAPEIQAELGLTGSYQMSFAAIAAVFLSVSLVGAVSNVIMYYAAVVLGQLFSGHRVVGAVAAYFAITGILAILSAPFMLWIMMTEGGITSMAPAEYTKNMLLFTTIFSVVSGIGLYALSYWVMNKKLNLA